MNPVKMRLTEVAVHLHPLDDVAIAKRALPAGATVALDLEGWGNTQLVLRDTVPSGHKIALRDLSQGRPLRRYGHVIGFASMDIALGDHVHTHNLNAAWTSLWVTTCTRTT